MAGPKIRIKLRAYDHRMLDVAARDIVEHVQRTGAKVVAQVPSQGTDGYDAVQLAYGQMRPRDVNRPTKGHFDKVGAEALRHLVELRTDDAATYTPGQEVRADVFSPGDTVDVVGVSKG